MPDIENQSGINKVPHECLHTDEFDEIHMKMDKLSLDVRQARKDRDENLIIQSETLRKIDQIIVALKGTEFDQSEENGHGGGIVKRLSRQEKITETLMTWKTKITTTSTIVYIIGSSILAFLSTVIVANWSNIFN